MSSNPYEAPQTVGEAPGRRKKGRKNLRSVAIFQKGIMVCILLYLLAIGSQFLVSGALLLLVRTVSVSVAIASATFVILLANKLYSDGMGILMGILTLIPCVGLIVLLIINGKATELLRRNGIDVGLMGANLSTIKSL